jgi:hypothetical protein
MEMSDKTNNRIEIICQVYGTNLERLRKLPRCNGNDLKALKEISKFLRDEEYYTLEDIGDLLFRDRSTISYYLGFDANAKSLENKSSPAASGALHSQ